MWLIIAMIDEFKFARIQLISHSTRLGTDHSQPPIIIRCIMLIIKRRKKNGKKRTLKALPSAFCVSVVRRLLWMRQNASAC